MGKLTRMFNQDPKKSRIPNPLKLMIFLAEPFVEIPMSSVATNTGSRSNVENRRGSSEASLSYSLMYNVVERQL
jgi:hypothetical protein